MTWWLNEKVQKARRLFADRFARRSPSWRDEWRRALTLNQPVGVVPGYEPKYVGAGDE
jgi:hypothetical protein